ncbi:MAG: alpha/beta fold hydrolase [Cyclobacteriaceae bacterium]
MSSLLHYVKHGSKSKVLLCFHGFGQEHGLWKNYLELLSDDYTIYLFDIFYHGKSTRLANYLSKDEWNQEIQEFLKKENIDRFSLLGFSLGGRFCLASYIDFHHKIDRMVLLAPDGIHRSFWYRLANSFLGNRLFKYLMYTPEKFERFVNVFKGTGIVRQSLIKFAERELGTMHDKDKVYKTWTYFSSLQVAPILWQQLSKEHANEILIILGKQDSIVRPQDIKAQILKASNISLIEIEGKHHHVVENAKVLVTSFMRRTIS